MNSASTVLRGVRANRKMVEILWHRRETRRQTEKTNLGLYSREKLIYSTNRLTKDSVMGDISSMMTRTLFWRLILILRCLRMVLKSRNTLLLENLPLRQQLAVLKRNNPRPRLCWFDRLFWIGLRRFWPKWRDSLIIVKPETVVRWHREGFRRYWRWRPTGRASLPKSLSKESRNTEQFLWTTSAEHTKT